MKRELFRFLLTGGVATAAHYVLFWVCIAVINTAATLASAVGYIFGSIFSYFMSYYFTFGSKRSHVEAMLLFYLMVGMGFFINTGVVYTLSAEFYWKPWTAQVCATGLTLIWNFFFAKLIVFRWRQ